MAKRKLSQPDDQIDLTPMIDMIFLLIIFFILAGKITSDMKNEHITVPPTETAEKIEIPDDWGHHVINVFGSSQNEAAKGLPPRNSIQFDGNGAWRSEGSDDMTGYQKLRNMLDDVYNESDHYLDPKTGMFKLPKVIIEIRADADTEYRVIQEVQQICAYTNDPYDMMKPRKPKNPKNPAEGAMPFVNLMFTTRSARDEK